MTSKVTLAGLFVVAAIGAAAAGGYLALRHNAADLPATTPEAAPDSVTPAAPSAPEPIAAPVPEPPAPADAPEPRAVARPSAQAPTPKRPVASTASTPDISTPAAPSTPVTPPAVEPAVVVPPPAGDPAPVPQPAVPAGAAAGQATPAADVRYEQLTVAADAVLGLRLDSTLSSETARPEDKVHARLTRDVLVDGRTAVAAGARLEGTVVSVERGGKFKDRPRLGFTFHTLVLADNTRVAIHTETVYREGDSPTGQANAKIGGSGVVGAILGGLIGGKKGAIVGSAVGAAGGAAAVASGDRADVVVTAGTPLTVRLTQPVSVLIERHYD